MSPNKSIYPVIVFTLLLLIKPNNSSSIGRYGAYYLTGYAITKTGDTLKNQQIIKIHNGVRDTFYTDSIGIYKIQVSWNTLCPTGAIIPVSWRKNQGNPKHVRFYLNDIKIKVRNDWRSMATYEGDSLYPPYKKSDLVF